MERRSVCISLSDLPARNRRLRTEDLRGIWGGCGDDGTACKEDSDCCAFIVCRADKKCHYLDGPTGM